MTTLDRFEADAKRAEAWAFDHMLTENRLGGALGYQQGLIDGRADERARYQALVEAAREMQAGSFGTGAATLRTGLSSIKEGAYAVVTIARWNAFYATVAALGQPESAPTEVTNG